MAIPKQCRARTKSGARCSAYAIRGSDFCLTHDPASGRQRAARNRRGGLAKIAPKPTQDMPPPQIESIGDVLALINATIRDVWALENTCPRARALLGAADMAIKALSVGELEARVGALEQVLKNREARP